MATSVSVSPEQIVSLPEISALGNPFTLTVIEEVAVHPNPSVVVTVYPVDVVGETVMQDVVALVFHAYVPPPVAQSVDDVPLQMGVFPPMEDVGESTTTHTESEAVPHTSVIVTV